MGHIIEASLPEDFIANIKVIFAHEDNEISTILHSHKPPIIKQLWNKLIPELQNHHDLCKNRSPLAYKKNKQDIIPDIIMICRFLSSPTEENPQLNLDRFFSVESTPMEQPRDLTNQADLISVVKQIRSELDTLKGENLENKDQIKVLKCENLENKGQIKVLKT